MNETLSFAGWRPGNPDQIIPWKEKFDEEYSDGGQLTLLSKEIYQAEADEDMPAFEYRYIIKAMDLQAFGSDQKTICIRLYICPLPQYWKPEVLKDLSEDNSADWFFEDAVNSDVLPYIGEEYLNYTDNDILPDKMVINGTITFITSLIGPKQMNYSTLLQQFCIRWTGHAVTVLTMYGTSWETPVGIYLNTSSMGKIG